MRWLELLNVEYGDCAVLVGKGPSALMVDCGSMNDKLRKPEMDMRDVFSFIRERYGAMAFRQFLLTHYHRDHLRGFRAIIKSRPDYFETIYLPYLPLDEAGGSPILEFALFAYAFAVPQTDAFQVNTACLTTLQDLSGTVGQQRIYTLKAGDRFVFDSIGYEVLNPPERDFTFGHAFLDGLARLQEAAACMPEFKLANAFFIRRYHACLHAFSSSVKMPAPVRLQAIEQLEAAFARVEALRPLVRQSPAADSVREILAGHTLREAYSAAVNDASVVFHNKRTAAAGPEDLLMTGDIDGKRLAALSEKLYPEYRTVKAPHHGTESGYDPVLRGLSIGHLLISNGDYQAGGGVAAGYHSMECMKHCTNRVKCGYSKEQKECCARLNRCVSLPGLAVKCPAVKNMGARKSCGIYVIAPFGGDPAEPAPKRSLCCLCDGRN